MAKINREKEAVLPAALLKELLRYEYETGMFYWAKKTSKYSSSEIGQVAGSVDKHGYTRIMINGYRYQAHRLAWLYVHGDYPDAEQPFIDHINGNRSDNRIVNLKASSGAENNRNVRIQSNNTSGVNGVRRYEKINPSGKIYTYWRAFWRDENGKGCEKNFPIHTYGEDEANQLAIIYRTEQIHLLEINFGIKYSERHGGVL